MYLFARLARYAPLVGSTFERFSSNACRVYFFIFSLHDEETGQRLMNNLRKRKSTRLRKKKFHREGSVDAKFSEYGAKIMLLTGLYVLSVNLGTVSLGKHYVLGDHISMNYSLCHSTWQQMHVK